MREGLCVAEWQGVEVEVGGCEHAYFGVTEVTPLPKWSR